MKELNTELTDKFSGQFDEVKNYMEKNVNALTQMTNKSSDNLSKNVTHIKEVCSNYFQSFETGLEEMRIRTHVIENKYSEWSKLLIGPTTLNDARLFALETRVQEEEEMRIKEYDFLRVLIKKLLFSLE